MSIRSGESSRRRARKDLRDQRKLTMRHRWYAGGIATLLSGALMFAGYVPAMADDTSSTASTTDASTPTPSPSPSDTPSATPSPTAAPTPTPSPSATQTTAPQTKTLTQQSVQAPVVNAPIASCPAGWPAAGSPVAGFEIDGNTCLNDTTLKDWASVGGQPVANDGYGDATEFTSGAKENNWPWSSGQTSGVGTAPNKTDIGNVYAYTQTVGGNVYAYLGFERLVNTGSVAYHVELNKLPNNPAGSPVTTRSVGDLRLTINQNGNNTISLVGADTWTGSAWSSLGSLSGFVGQVNQDTITNIGGDSLAAGTFAEAAINLTALFGSQGCSGNYGVLNVRSSASPEDTSSLADWIKPIALSVPSTCSTITILKKDAATGALLPGANFTITPNPATGTGSTTGTTDANGQIVFNGNVLPGTYTVTETQAPAGYFLPSTVSQQVTVGEAESKTLTFNDPLGSVNWVKKDQDGNLLGGATFKITATGGAAAAAPWNLNTNPITVVDNGARDTNPAAGQIAVSGLPSGSYSVVETVAPVHYTLDATPQTFTLSQANQTVSLGKAFVNNIIKHTITLQKTWVNGVPGDKAVLHINGDAGVTSTAKTPFTAGSWTDPNTDTMSVPEGSTVTVTENVSGAGSYTSTLACTGGVTPTSGSFTVPSTDVTCTFTNTAKTATVNVYKHWRDAIAGDTADLSVSGAGQSGSHHSVAAGGNNDDATPATITVPIGMPITVGETLGAGNQGSYSTTLDCGAAETSGQFTLTGDTTCVYTNSNGKINITLKKKWVNPVTGDSADLQINGATGATSPAVNGLDNTNVAQASVLIGSTVSVGEVLHGIGAYDTSYSCTTNTGSPWTSGTPVPLGVSSIACVVTNTVKTANVVVKKSWVGGIAGDATNVSLNQNGSPLMTGSSTVTTTGASQTDQVVNLAVAQNTSVNVSESLGGSNKASYTATYSCVVTGTQTALDPTGFAVPAAGATCVVTNTAKTVTVNLNKKWVHGAKGDSTSLKIAPAAGEGSTVTGTSTVTVPDETDAAGIDTISTTVTSGGTANLSEVLSPANFAAYGQSLSCDAGTLSSGTLTVPKAGGTVTCTFTNTVAQTKITLQKNWQGGVKGDKATLTLTGATNAVSTYNGTNGIDAANTTSVTVNQGSTVTVNELLAGAGTYNQTVDCGNGSSPLGSGLQVLVGQTAITCTITNTAATGNVTLIKKWVNSIGGDSTQLGITAEGTTENATATTAGGTVTSAQQATKKVTAGASVALGESAPGPKGSYDAQWSCDNGVTLGAGNTFTMPVTDVTCTVVNTNKLVNVTLHKAWLNAQPGDQSVIKLSQDGPGVPSGSATATAPNDSPVSLSVPWGATVTTGETLNAGNHASYTASTLCSNQASSQSDAVTFTATGASVDCTITNSATQATVHLYKNWVGSVKGDSTTLSVTGGHNASNHTSVSTGGDDTDGTAATADAYTGQTVGLNETTVAGSGFAYDSSLTCYNGQTALTVTNGQITIPADATNITCTFTNTLKVGKLTLVKALDIKWGGTTPASAWTLTADGPGGSQVQGTTGVSKTVPIGSYALTEAPAIPGYQLESIVCTNGDANVPVVNGSVNLTSGANVVCTYTNADQPALLTLHKIVDETAAGGSVTPDQFTLTATPIIPPTPAGTLPVFGNGLDGVENRAIPAGQYTLSESGPSGFLAETWTCVGGSVSATDPINHTATLTVANGQSASCSITNTAIQPKLTLVKVVDNGAFNGAGRVQDWTLTAAGNGLPTVTGQGGSSSIVSQGVKVGTYDLSEQATGGAFRTDGYTLTSLVCSNGNTSLQNPTVTLHEGDDVTCTFTNTPTPAKWTISKTSDKGLAVMPGDTIHYTLTITHVAGTSWPAPGVGLNLTNLDNLAPLAANATIVPGSLLASFGTPTITANELSWTAGDLSNLVQTGSFTINYAFTVNAGAWNVQLPNALTPPQDTFSCVGDNGCVTLSETPDVNIWKTSEVTKDADPANASSVLPGGQVTYTLHATNPTGVPLVAGQTETDDLSQVLVNGATLGTLGAGLSFDGDHTLTWTLPDIAAGATVSVSFTVNVSSHAGPYDLVNSMVPGTIGHCPGQWVDVEAQPTDEKCTTTNHVPKIDLGIVKTYLLAEGQTAVDDDPGATSAYTYGLEVTNNSDTAVKNATVTDTLPSQITLDTTKGTNGFDNIPAGWHPTYDPATNKVTIAIDTFAVGGSGSITLHVQVKPVVVTGPVAEPGASGPTPVTYPTTIDNTACVSVALDTNADNNCSTVKVPQKTINGNIYVQCLGDVPYLHYDITATNVDPSLPVTLTWTANQPGVGGVPSTDLPPDPASITRTLHIGDSGQILWPGGEVLNNVGIGFPGWRPIVESDLNPDGTLKDPHAITFEGLIYDPSTVATDAWRYESTVTLHVNPTQTVTVSYPPASAACAAKRPTDLTITKTASVESTAPGGSFTYDLAVKNVNLGAASPVTVTDKIPADLKITGITTSTTAFPRWKDCAVTGQDSSGYGGTLTCSLFGPLKLNESAPTITLAATVSPTTTEGEITNTGVVTWTNTDNPNDKGSAESSVTVTLPQPLVQTGGSQPLALTGGTLMLGLLPFGMLVILGGTGLLLVTRRRRNRGDKEPQV